MLSAFITYNMTDQTSCCVDDGLESVPLQVGQPTANYSNQALSAKTGDERHNIVTRQRPLDAPQLAQDAETSCSSLRDVCRHKRISVQINAEVSNGADGRNVVSTDTEWYGGNLCMRRLDARHITSVFAVFSCRQMLLIHADMLSIQEDMAF